MPYPLCVFSNVTMLPVTFPSDCSSHKSQITLDD